MRRCAVLTVFMLFLSASFARAEFYHWVDREGKEFFTNNREQVPQEYRNNVIAVKPDENRVSVGKKSASTGVSSPSRNDHKDKYGKGEVHWRKRATKLRKELAALQDKYDLLLKREREDENKPKKLTAKNSSKTMNSRSSQKKKETLEKDISRKKHELEVELPDEARKAEAYPVWIRE
jgi:predicted  nucleic acid-binding Zn-ribbon protein